MIRQIYLFSILIIISFTNCNTIVEPEVGEEFGLVQIKAEITRHSTLKRLSELWNQLSNNKEGAIYRIEERFNDYFPYDKNTASKREGENKIQIIETQYSGTDLAFYEEMDKTYSWGLISNNKSDTIFSLDLNFTFAQLGSLEYEQWIVKSLNYDLKCKRCSDKELTFTPTVNYSVQNQTDNHIISKVRLPLEIKNTQTTGGLLTNQDIHFAFINSSIVIVEIDNMPKKLKLFNKEGIISFIGGKNHKEYEQGNLLEMEFINYNRLN